MLDKIPLLLIGLLEIVTGLGIITFWILFFTTELMAPENPPEGYFAHEHAFVWPDSLMALGLVLAGILLILKVPAGGSVSLVCSGGLMFLGIIDLAYDTANGLFQAGILEAAQNAAIDLWVLVFGIFLVIRFV